VWLYVPSGAWRSAPEPAGSSWKFGSPSAPATALWPTLSGTPSPRPFSWRGWRTRPWIKLLSGTTWPPSTADRGVADWISSLPASPARPSAPPAAGGASRTTGGSGPTSPGWFAKQRHGSCSSSRCRDCWYQPQASLLDSGTFCETWPRSGSMRSGACYRRPPLAPATAGNGFGFWPTATAGNSRSSGGNPHTTATHHTTLTDRAVRLWPTPAARDSQRSPEAAIAAKARMPGGAENPDHFAGGSGQALAQPDDQRPLSLVESAGQLAAMAAGDVVADAGVPGREGVLRRALEGRAGPEPPGGGLLWPPGPDDDAGWRDAIAAGRPQPAVRGVAPGLAHRLDRLHTTGNGVVPLVAAYAFLRLAQRAGLTGGGRGGGVTA
jgi:hypothetical protein